VEGTLRARGQTPGVGKVLAKGGGKFTEIGKRIEGKVYRKKIPKHGALGDQKKLRRSKSKKKKNKKNARLTAGKT